MIKKRIPLLSLAVAAALMLSGCNTMAGFGKDLEKLGEQMQEKSKK